MRKKLLFVIDLNHSASIFHSRPMNGKQNSASYEERENLDSSGIAFARFYSLMRLRFDQTILTICKQIVSTRWYNRQQQKPSNTVTSKPDKNKLFVVAVVAFVVRPFFMLCQLKQTRRMKIWAQACVCEITNYEMFFSQRITCAKVIIMEVFPNETSHSISLLLNGFTWIDVTLDLLLSFQVDTRTTTINSQERTRLKKKRNKRRRLL